MQRAYAGPSALSGSLACRLGRRWCPLGTSAPKGGGKTELSANFWLRIDLVPSLGAATSRWDAVQQSTGAAAVTERARCYRPGKAQATKGCQAVSLAFSHALRVYKGKVVGLCPTTRKLFEKSLTKNFYARSARLLARTCAILSMSTSGSELPKARIESPGTGQNFYARYRSAPLCTCVV